MARSRTHARTRALERTLLLASTLALARASRSHARTPSHAHSHSHSHARSHSRARTRTRTHARSHARSHAHARSRSHSYARTLALARALALARSTHALARTLALALARTPALARSRSHSRRSATLAALLRGRAVVHFVDNTVALSAVVHGCASEPDLGAVVDSLHETTLGLRCYVWAEWVQSAANIADWPSRSDKEHLVPATAVYFGMTLPGLPTFASMMADGEEVRVGRRRAAAAPLPWFPDMRVCRCRARCALRLRLLSAMGGGAVLA